MSELNKQYTRFPFLLLPYTMRYMAITNEIFMDYEAGVLYYKHSNGSIIPLSDSGFIDHIQDYDNPHLLTAEILELENVLNIRQASKEELDRHTLDHNNPHRVTKKHIGLDKVPNVMQASKIELDNLKNSYLTMMEEVEELLSRPIYQKLYELIIDTIPEEAHARVFYDGMWNDGKIHNVPAGEYEYEVFVEPPEEKYTLTINTSPHESKVEVFFNDRWNLNKIHSLPNGTYEVRVSSAGYIDELFNTIISDSDKLENILLRPIKYNLTINTTPEDALVKVYYNGKLNEGKTHELPNGDYPVQISRNRYEFKEDIITILNSDKIVDIVLDESKYSLTVNTSPQDAKVEVFYNDEWNVGNAHNLINGEYSIKVSKGRYIEKQENITILNSSVSVQIDLDPVRHQLDIITTQDNCKVEVFYNNIWNVGLTHSLPNGTYNVRVSKPDYNNKEISVDIFDSDKSIEVSLELTEYVLTINPIPSDAIVSVKINDIWETAEYNKFSVLPGNYEIEVVKDGYRTNTTIAIVGRSNTTLNVVLSKLYLLTINTTPIGADVRVKIDGLWMDGNTHMVQAGSYEIEAEYDGYYRHTSTISLSADKTVDVSLMLLKYTLTIDTTPTDAVVMVYYNDTWNSGKVHSIPNGEYSVYISRDGYFSQSHTISILDSNLSKSYELISEKYNLDITTNPSDSLVEVYYNNIWNPGNNHLLSNGSYNVRVSKIGYDTKTITTSILSSNKTENVILDKAKYSLTINTNPSEANVEVYYNGSWNSGNTHLLPNGNYNIRISKDMYATHTSTVIINDSHKTESINLIRSEYTLTINPIPSLSSVQVYYNGRWNSGKVHIVPNGTYNVIITRTEFKDYSGSITVNGEDRTVQIQLYLK